MLYDGITRHQLAKLAVSTLQAANTDAGPRVFDAGAWPTRPDLFPLILVEAPRERKAGIMKGGLQFNTTISLVVIGRVAGTTQDGVNDAIDALIDQIENALLCTTDFVVYVQSFVTVETQRVVTAEAKQTLGEVGMTFEIEVFQSYGPTGDPLTDISATITNPTTGLPTDIGFDVKPPQ